MFIAKEFNWLWLNNFRLINKYFFNLKLNNSMKKFKLFLFAFSLIAFFACSSSSEDDDCLKTIVVRPEYNFQSQFGTVYYPEIAQDVPCNFPEPEVAQSIGELPKLSEFSYTILEYNFIPDTGNNTGIIEFKIELNNLSNAKVKGFPYLTIAIGGGAATSSSFDGCTEIEANSNCTITYSNEYSLDLGIVNTFEIVDVEYLLID